MIKIKRKIMIKSRTARNIDPPCQHGYRVTVQ
jgi:hypothetical protein